MVYESGSKQKESMKLPVIDTRYRGELTINGRRYKGRVFNHEGREMEVYKVHVLAAALGKTSPAIEQWEKQKLLPMPLYYVQGDNVGLCRRWYSREQIINMNQVIHMIPYGRGNGHRQYKAPFFKAIRAVFAQPHVVTLTKKDSSHVEPDKTNPNPVRVSADASRNAPRGLTSPPAVARNENPATRKSRPVASPKYNPSIRE